METSYKYNKQNVVKNFRSTLCTNKFRFVIKCAPWRLQSRTRKTCSRWKLAFFLCWWRCWMCNERRTVNWRTKARHNTSKLLFLFMFSLIFQFSLNIPSGLIHCRIFPQFAPCKKQVGRKNNIHKQTKYSKPWTMMMCWLLLPLLSIHTIHSRQCVCARARSH